jgi:hypothetical protein
MTWSLRPLRAVAVLAAGAMLATIGTWSVALAQPVQAAADTITVNYVSSPDSESGLLEISLTASSPITSLSAGLYAAGATTPSVTITSFTPPGTGPQSSGVWTVSSPIPWGTGSGDLPLGIYSVEVTASDQGGTTVMNVQGGNLDFLIDPSLTFAASPSTISYGDQTVTFSGLVTGTDPDGNTSPVQGAVVTISPQFGGSGFTATTVSDGSYTATEEVTQTNWQASVTGGPAGLNTAANTLQLASLTITPDVVTLSAELAKSDVNYGQTDTVSGVATYLNGSTTQPLKNFPISIDGGPTVSETVTTNSAGQYTATLTPADLVEEAEYGVTVSAGEYNSYFVGASQYLPVTVNWPAKITRVSEHLNALAAVSASGCIVYTLASMKNDQSTAPIWVDYAKTAHGPWRALGKMSATWNGTQMCPAVGANWVRRFKAKLPNAWYRERIAAAPGIESAVSKPVHLSRIFSRIVDFHVHPTAVSSGGSITVSGHLQQRTRHWHALGHQVVLIVLRPKGQSKWYWIKKVRTSASGHFTSTITDPGSASWSAVFEGGSRYFVSAARTVYVRVTSATQARPWSLPGSILPDERPIAKTLGPMATPQAWGSRP